MWAICSLVNLALYATGLGYRQLGGTEEVGRGGGKNELAMTRALSSFDLAEMSTPF